MKQHKLNRHGLPILDSPTVKKKVKICSTEKCIGIAMYNGLCEGCYAESIVNEGYDKWMERSNVKIRNNT